MEQKSIGATIFENLKERYMVGNKFRILFCPYKEEMWDSMQTIYDSALQDKDTVTALMPIPYFKLFQMRPQKIEMEFNSCCSDFPDVLNNGWDIIIIHYPYDQRNTITRPLLTSYMLKFFCRKLVFVHYAVVGKREWKEEEVLLPAIINADLCIFESCRHAQNVKEILEAHNVHNEIVGWGSPKYDYLDCPYDLPRNWKKKVAGKKVVLFNTSIIPYMSSAGKLPQIEQTLKELMSRDDICVWWRPHPLYEQAILTHRPSELVKYNELKEMVKNSRHILDETENLHRAISMTDELVSDKSSVVTLYEYTGKPIIMLEEL